MPNITHTDEELKANLYAIIDEHSLTCTKVDCKISMVMLFELAEKAGLKVERSLDDGE